MAFNYKKKILYPLLLGSLVIILTPFIAGFIPAMVDLKVITLGGAISAGISAIVSLWVLGKIKAFK